MTLPVSLSPDDVLLQEKLQLIQEHQLPPRLTFGYHGYLTTESKQLVRILSAQSSDAFDKDHQYSIPYIVRLLNDYAAALDQCTEDEKFVKYYLNGQKLIVHKAIENSK